MPRRAEGRSLPQGRTLSTRPAMHLAQPVAFLTLCFVLIGLAAAVAVSLLVVISRGHRITAGQFRLILICCPIWVILALTSMFLAIFLP